MLKQLSPLLLLCLCIACTPAIASENFVTLNGKIFELNLADSTEKHLAGIPVEIWQEDSLIATILTNEKGKYSAQLPFYHMYTVKYGHAPYVRKMIEVDATDFAQHTQKRGYTISIDITLFTKEQCKGFDFLETVPIARASYSKEEDSVVWNTQHIYNIHERIGEAITGCRNTK
ncbi:MAG: hypothetical protein ACKVOR_12135 [Flavobacteriales bacterium]